MLYHILLTREFMSAVLTDKVLDPEMVRVHVSLEVELGVVRLGAVYGHAAVEDDQVVGHFYIRWTNWLIWRESRLV